MSTLSERAPSAEPASDPELPLARLVTAVLSPVGLLVSAYLSMYKLGYLGAIQCGTGGCETVQSSRYAYFVGMPVAIWGLGAYGALLALELAGVQPRWASSPRLGWAILALATVGVVFSAYLTWKQP